MKKIIFLTLLTIVFNACEESEIEEKTTYLESVKIGSRYLYKYEYDDKKRVTNITHYDYLGRNSEEETRTYNNDNELVERNFQYADGSFVSYATFTYFLPDSIRQDHYKEPNSALERYDIYLFDSTTTCNFKGRYTYNPLTNALLYHYTSTSLDNNCSALLTDYRETGEVLKQSKFVVNNANSAYQKVNLPFLKGYNNHSIVEVRISDQNDKSFEKQSYTSIFEYNNLDFPKSEIRTYEDGSELTLTYHYLRE